MTDREEVARRLTLYRDQLLTRMRRLPPQHRDRIKLAQWIRQVETTLDLVGEGSRVITS